MIDETPTKKRGRPKGHKLSSETKDKIRRSREGRSHSIATREKISKSRIKYFKKRDLLADSLGEEYLYIDPSQESNQWIVSKHSKINSFKDVFTNRRMMYMRQVELYVGSDSELFSHSATPEFFLSIKEELEAMNLIEELKELASII
jgi:hypothetical protein